MEVPVSLDLASVKGNVDVLAVIRRADARQKTPKKWWKVEYAAVKADMTIIVNAFENPRNNIVTLDLFEWSVLIGELGRLHKDESKATKTKYVADIIHVYIAIKNAIKGNYVACKVLKESMKIDEGERLRSRLERKKEKVENQIIQLDNVQRERLSRQRKRIEKG